MIAVEDAVTVMNLRPGRAQGREQCQKREDQRQKAGGSSRLHVDLDDCFG
jgi:hypothetical protein